MLKTKTQSYCFLFLICTITIAARMSSKKSAGVKKIMTLRDLKEKKKATGGEIGPFKVTMLTTPESYTMAQKTSIFMSDVRKLRNKFDFKMDDATLERFKTAFIENVEAFSLVFPNYSYTWKGQGKVDIRRGFDNDNALHCHEFPEVEVMMALMEFVKKIDKIGITFDADFEKQFAMSWWPLFLCAKMFVDWGPSGLY